MLPNMVDSLRITLGWCWTYLIVAEIVASNSGIGYDLWTARRYVQDAGGLGRHPRRSASSASFPTRRSRFVHRRWFRYLLRRAMAGLHLAFDDVTKASAPVEVGRRRRCR